MNIDEQRINEAIETEGPGSSVRDMFAPFLKLLRDLARQEDIASFSIACDRMSSSDRNNRNVVLDEDVPPILISVYLPLVIPDRLWEPLHRSGKLNSWHALLAPALTKPEELQFRLDAIVAEAEKLGSA
ncbi:MULTISPECIES: hypothetical protein [Achromobacter]|uniref:hypothetical protein n=1 Tax=Achromobacter TaxID=222 RepID=UPI0012FD3F4B|nr:MULTISPECIES: hypothetical protein [Achromobacter]